MLTNQLLQIEGNTIGLHYRFNDPSHTIDAFVHNKCEFQFLNLIKEIAATLNILIVIETEPLADGGIRSWLKILSPTKKEIVSIRLAILTALAVIIITTPISTTLSKLIDKAIEYVFADNELKNLEKEKLKLEIIKLKNEESKVDELLNNNVIKKRRSNFYEALEYYPKVTSLSFIFKNLKNNSISEFYIERNKFKDFILVTDDLEPEIIDDTVIEIISPVLKKGKYKWMGFYNGNIVHFNMLSKEFQELVQLGKIEFKNGTSINCLLNIRKKIDNEGIESIIGYDVLRVNSYFDNDKPIETPEFRRFKQTEVAKEKQLNLFNSK